MDDIELRQVQLQFPTLRLHGEDDDLTFVEARVRTDRGDLVVAVQGDPGKPAIITYHDIGLNHGMFLPFFNYSGMRPVLKAFCVYHVNAPGQEDGAPSFPEDYKYPTIDELANQINYVIGHFEIKNFFGFGIGAGANVLMRYALLHPDRTNGIAVINCSSTHAGWVEWAYQKLNIRSLRKYGMTAGVIEYLMWHHFGRSPEERNQDLSQSYRMYFHRHVNPNNLAFFIEAYVNRNDLGISRDGMTLKVPVLNITGAMSPHINDTVTLNGRLNPTISTWMKVSDTAFVLEEDPNTVAEAFRLFLQGEGFVAPLSQPKEMVHRRMSDGDRQRSCRHSSIIRITENPISEAVVC